MKLGIFDSGIGGEAVYSDLKVAFPSADIVLVDDKKNLPYGNKSSEIIRSLTTSAIQPLLNQRCDIIILACNTATAEAIEHLRSLYPDQLFIGFEPMLKPARNLTKTGTIALCATPATLKSARYQSLKQKYSDMLILEPDCSQWAYMIENDTLNNTAIKQTIEHVLARRADVIILGCTHYHWIEEKITEIVNGRAKVIQPTKAIIRRVRSLLS